MAVRGYDEAYCRVCETGAHVREVKMPYACKLLVQELMACCVAFRFRFDPPTTTAATNGAASPSQDPRPISEKNTNADQYNTASGGVHNSPGHDHGNNYGDDNNNNDVDDRDGGLGDRNESSTSHVREAASRMEGAGPGGSVLAALPPPALDGILGRIETLLKAAAPDGHKRKRDHDDMDN
nr:RNA polymerase rbp2 [Pandoravirus aubagnensis]